MEAADWTGEARALDEFLVREGLSQEVVFHGTSSVVIDLISSEGLSPTDVTAAVQNNLGWDSGSFWGTPRTAIAYALDSARERYPGSNPALIASPVSILEHQCQLVCDGATIDFPLKGLTRLDEPGIRDKWESADFDLPWQESLADLGAIVALHDFYLDSDDFLIVRDPADLRRVAEELNLVGAGAQP